MVTCNNFAIKALLALVLLLQLSQHQQAAAAAADANAINTSLSVNVYEGPTECEDDDRAQTGNYLLVHYVGKIDGSSETGERGRTFGSSRDSGRMVDFQVGEGQVIQGWDEGVVGLCKGAKATLVIPPGLAYGAASPSDDIPGGATLNVDIEIVDVLDGPPPKPNVFGQIDRDGNNKIAKDELEAFLAEQARRYPQAAEGGTTTADLIMKKEDADGDGYISWFEFGGPKGDIPLPPIPDKDEQRMLFEKYDTNGDKKLSKEEFGVAFEEQGIKIPDGLLDGIDLDGDGSVSWEEYVGEGEDEHEDEEEDEEADEERDPAKEDL